MQDEEETTWQTPQTVVATWRDGNVAIENYEHGASVIASPDVLLILALCSTPKSSIALAQELKHRGVAYDPETLQKSLNDMAAEKLLEKNSSASRGLTSFIPLDATWALWGPEAQYFHFVTKDAPYLELQAEEREYVSKIEEEGEQPPIFKCYPDAPRILLPRQLRTPQQAFVDVLRSRRTIRRFSGEPVPIEALSALLQLSFSPQYFIDAGVFGVLPFRPYANAGARSEAEIYLNILDVDNLDAGLYHYNCVEHSLEWLRDEADRELISHLSYKQPMISEASVVFFVSAVLERMGHKYAHPRTLRAMYYDVGHLAQVYAMCATALGLAPNQTAALRDSEVESLLRLDGVSETVLYCFGLGLPALDNPLDMRHMTLASATRSAILQHAKY